MNLYAKGKLLKVYIRPQTVDKETNQPKAPEFGIQLLQEIKVKNSTDTKNDLCDLKINSESVNDYKSKIGKDIEVCCSLFSRQPIYVSEI